MIQIRLVSDLKNKFADIEDALDAADFDAKNNLTRYTHEEVFDSIRNKLKNLLSNHHLH
ncbi:MAG: hypothetical protein IKP66_04900 [Lachnospiraceae bacterium]|nr:hypothetical protein [Lachnospiraceae bacterium]